MMIVCPENFGNLRSDFYNKETFSDLTLHIYDTEKPGQVEPLVIHSHFLVLYSASAYIRKCLTGFENDPSRSVNRSNNKTTLRIQLDSVDEEVVRLFFSLFYMNRFDKAHISMNGIDQSIHENSLALYSLAKFFFFDTLVVYIEKYFRENMRLSFFASLSAFCLRMNEMSGLFYVDQPQCGVLFKNLIQWYTCCVKPPTTEEFIAGQRKGDPANVRYYADNKRAILHDLEHCVENIDECALPRQRVRRLSETRIELDHHHRVCDECLSKSTKRNTVDAFYYLDMGSLSIEDANATERFFMRLKKKKRAFFSARGVDEDEDEDEEEEEDDDDINIIELTMIRKHQLQQQEAVLERYSCSSRVTLLSRKNYQEKPQQCRYTKRNLSIPSEVNNFKTTPIEHCYEAHCDHCAKLRPVHIIMLSLTLEREGMLLLPPEDMSMSVEESPI